MRLRRLRTLLKDPNARAAVGAAAATSEGLSEEEFGLLCYEAGRASTMTAGLNAMTTAMLIGEPDAFGRLYRAELLKRRRPRKRT